MKTSAAGSWTSLAGPLLIAASGAAMAAWTWGTWPDPVVDFGRELYVPWRLAAGDVLYRDIAWFNGPLSPSFNALLFRLFGVGLSTLVWANLVLLTVGVALLWRLCVRLSDRLSATVACLLFLLVFAFGQLVGIANYNWVCPYSHEATHGVLLGLGALVCLDTWAGGREPRAAGTGGLAWVAGAGLLCGLAFLTKAETFLAAAAGSAAALAAGQWSTRRGLGAIPAAVFAAGLVLPILAAFGWLMLELPAEVAWRGVLGSWPSVFEGRVSELPFYRAGIGLDRPGQRLSELALWALGWSAALLPAAALGRTTRGRPVRVLALSSAAATALVLWFLRETLPWNDVLRPLPLFMLIGAGLAARCVIAERRGGSELAFALFSLVLLAKMLLHARALNYGFTLALPASALVAVWIVGRLPAWLDRRGPGQGALLRGAACALLLFGAGRYVHKTAGYLEHKQVTVGEGPDRFRADVRGGFMNETLAVLSSSGASSMLVVPEGVMLNYLARIPNPTPFVNFMPPEELLFGQDAWLQAIEAAPPQVICVIHKDTSEYGFEFFGADYATEFRAWIDARYRVITQIGEMPLQRGTRFGVQLLALGKQP